MTPRFLCGRRNCVVSTLYSLKTRGLRACPDHPTSSVWTTKLCRIYFARSQDEIANIYTYIYIYIYMYI